jgi:diguanylate cyclase (GGDEF)-like protein
MQRLRKVTLVLGIVLVVSGLTAGLTAGHLADARRRALTTQLVVPVTATEDYFHRAATVTQLTAHNPVLMTAYDSVGAVGRPTPDTLPPGVRARINSLLQYLETLFPGQVSEACFIDVGGAELARVIAGQIPGMGRLSPDERTNPFFAPTLARPDTVYQARPYLSPDTKTWVVSNSTGVRDASGAVRAVLHFEVTLASLRPTLAAAGPDARVQVVDATDGAIVVDSRSDISASAPSTGGGYPVADWGPQGVRAIDDQMLAYQRLPRATGNENDWFLVITAPAQPAGWRSALDTGPVVITMLGLLVLGLAAAGFAQRSRSVRARLMRDELTGLVSRAAVAGALERGMAGGPPYAAVLVVDLDRFKQVNEFLGQTAGDQLLVEVARRLERVSSMDDVVGRLGGNAFAVLLSGPVDPAVVLHRAREVGRLLEAPFTVGEVTLRVPSSVGVALVGEHGTDASTVMRRADVAMYEAKRRRVGVVVFDPDHEAYPATTLALETALLQAIEQNELVLHYQPQVDIRTGRVISVEALVRWNHPTQGLIGPDHFIPAAEGSGLIVELTKHVLVMALDQICRWREAGADIPVAVNLGARNVADPQLPAEVLQLLAERDLPPGLLRLELTETDILGDPEQARQVLEQLRSLGVALAVDDFGTGFASLSQLRRLPFAELKIDRSFVMQLEADPQARHIVDSVIRLAHGLGLSVTAEGVETQQCLDVLAAIGCDVAQGYFLSRPLPGAQALAWIRRHDHLSMAHRSSLQRSALPQPRRPMSAPVA